MIKSFEPGIIQFSYTAEDTRYRCIIILLASRSINNEGKDHASVPTEIP